MLQATLVILTALHLLAMATASALPFLISVLPGSREDSSPQRASSLRSGLARQMIGHGIVALTVGVILGGIAGVIFWREFPHTFSSAMPRIPPRKFWFAGGEIVFSLACLALAHWMLRGAARGENSKATRWTVLVLCLLSSTNLLYHFPLLFSAIAVLSIQGDVIADPILFPGFFFRPDVFWRATHFVIAAFSLAGVHLAWAAHSRSRLPLGDETILSLKKVETSAVIVSLVGVVAQFLTGIYLATLLPAEARDRLLGEDLWSVACLAGAIIASAAVLHFLCGNLINEKSPTALRRAWIALVLIFFLMSGSRHRGRIPYLEKNEDRISPNAPLH